MLRAGGLLGLPTETVYGLAADATNASAVVRIYEVKGRPNDHPVIVHIADAAQLRSWARQVPAYAAALAAEFWPGPMTLVLPRAEVAQDFVTGGQNTVGLRVPNHPVALAVLQAFGGGVAAPSANLFGQVSPTSAAAVLADLGNRLTESDAVIDGGDCQVGVESTIIDCTGDLPSILRPGAITAADIERVTGLALVDGNGQVRVPGSLAAHYAPTAQVRLAADRAELAAAARELSAAGLIALAELATPTGMIRLASPADASEYAQQLYAALRAADAAELDWVIAVPPVGVDIADAVRDRLQRAAHRG